MVCTVKQNIPYYYTERAGYFLQMLAPSYHTKLHHQHVRAGRGWWFLSGIVLLCYRQHAKYVRATRPPSTSIKQSKSVAYFPHEKTTEKKSVVGILRTIIRVIACLIRYIRHTPTVMVGLFIVRCIRRSYQGSQAHQQFFLLTFILLQIYIHRCKRKKFLSN